MPHYKCDDVLKPSLKATHPSLLAKETPSHGMEDKNAIYIQKPMSPVAYNGESAMYVNVKHSSLAKVYYIHNWCAPLVLISYHHITHLSIVPLPPISR